jgi:hypothetical protein
MTKCHRYYGLLMGYFDHEIDGPEREALDRHLDSCSHCRAMRDDLAGILKTLEDGVPPEPEPYLETLVLNRVMSLPVQRVGDRNRLLKAVYGALGGLAALLFLGLVLSFQDMGYPELLQAGRDYLYWSTAIIVDLQIAYGLVSGLFPLDMYAVFDEVQVASILAVLMSVIVAVKVAFGRFTAEDPHMS